MRRMHGSGRRSANRFLHHAGRDDRRRLRGHARRSGGRRCHPASAREVPRTPGRSVRLLPQRHHHDCGCGASSRRVRCAAGFPDLSHGSQYLPMWHTCATAAGGESSARDEPRTSRGRRPTRTKRSARYLSGEDSSCRIGVVQHHRCTTRTRGVTRYRAVVEAPCRRQDRPVDRPRRVWPRCASRAVADRGGPTGRPSNHDLRTWPVHRRKP